MTLEHEIGSSCSFQQMIDFLSDGEDIDVENFDTIANKPLAALYEELTGRDVVLRKDPVTKRVTRCAQSVKLMIINPVEKHYLLEVSREYPNGNVVPVCKESKPFSTWYSLSETRKRGELAVLGVIRGVWEELNVNIFDMSELRPIHLEVPDFHQSTAFPGLWSLVYNSWFEWKTGWLSTQIDLPTIRDNGVIINREWHPIT